MSSSHWRLRALCVTTLCLLSTPGLAAPPRGSFEVAWVTQNGNRSSTQKLFLESFKKSESPTFKYVWVRMIWTFAGEQLTVRMQSLTLKGASNKEALGCDVELSTEVRWEKDALVIPGNVAASGGVNHLTREVKKGSTSTADPTSVRQSCNTSLDKGRYAVTVRDDGVVLLTDSKAQAVLELEPAGDVEPKFSERFKALVK